MKMKICLPFLCSTRQDVSIDVSFSTVDLILKEPLEILERGGAEPPKIRKLNFDFYYVVVLTKTFPMMYHLVL